MLIVFNVANMNYDITINSCIFIYWCLQRLKNIVTNVLLTVSQCIN